MSRTNNSKIRKPAVCLHCKIFVQCQKLKIFNVSGESSQLLDFLATQERLKEFALLATDYDVIQLFETPIPDEFIPFRLKKLSLMKILVAEIRNGDDNLMELVKLHVVNSLEELEVDHSLPESFFEFAFAQLNHLKTLKLKTSRLSQDSSFFERLAVNTSVTSLQVSHNGYVAPLIKGFINRLPNIENLPLDFYCKIDLAKHIEENLKALKKFSVKYIDFEELSGLRFHALEALHIDHLPALINWDVFAEGNNGIIDLLIGSMWPQSSIDVQAITRNLKLRQLTIESSKLSCDAKFFEIIRENCANLESLQLNDKCLMVDISTVADIPNLRFRDFSK